MKTQLLILLLLICSCTAREQHPQSAPVSPDKPRLFLLSKGLVTENLKRELLNFLDREARSYRVAVIPNATGKEEKKLKKVRKAKERFASMGFDSTRVDNFDLQKQKPEALDQYDIIYLLGGNPFYLLDQIKKAKADEKIKTLAGQSKIIMGYSAGALILGPDLHLMNQVDSLLEFNSMQLKDLKGLGLYRDFEIFPHYDEFTRENPGLKEAIEQYEKTSGRHLYKITDAEGLIVEAGKPRIIR